MSSSIGATTLGAVNYSSFGSFTATAPINYPPSNLQTSFNFNYPLSYTIGSGTQQLQYACTGTALAATTNTIILSSSGNLLDPCNNTVAFANVGLAIIQNRMPLGSTQTLTMKPGATHGVSWPQLGATGITLTPQNVAVVQDLYTNMAVSAGANDQIDVVSSAGTCTFSFVFLGR